MNYIMIPLETIRRINFIYKIIEFEAKKLGKDAIIIFSSRSSDKKLLDMLINNICNLIIKNGKNRNSNVYKELKKLGVDKFTKSDVKNSVDVYFRNIYLSIKFIVFNLNKFDQHFDKIYTIKEDLELEELFWKANKYNNSKKKGAIVFSKDLFNYIYYIEALFGGFVPKEPTIRVCRMCNLLFYGRGCSVYCDVHATRKVRSLQRKIKSQK